MLLLKLLLLLLFTKGSTYNHLKTVQLEIVLLSITVYKGTVIAEPFGICPVYKECFISSPL